MFVFDETFKTLHGQGGPIDLALWYNQEGISIAHAAFVCGSEELVLVDSSARARVFSLDTMQFRCDSCPSVRSRHVHAYWCLEDRNLYSFNRHQALYIRPQTDPAS